MTGAYSRVPVEHRWAGLDRRTILPALGVLFVGVLWAYVMPAIDGAIHVSRPVRPGTVLAAGSAVTFTPSVGWQILSGLTVGRGGTGAGRLADTAEVAEGGAEFRVQQVDWNGSLRDLLNRAGEVNEIRSDPGSRFNGAEASFTTAQGVTGISEPFVTGDGPGQLSVLLRNGVGAEILATGPNQENTAVAQSFAQMQWSVMLATPTRIAPAAARGAG